MKTVYVLLSLLFSLNVIYQNQCETHPNEQSNHVPLNNISINDDAYNHKNTSNDLSDERLQNKLAAKDTAHHKIDTLLNPESAVGIVYKLLLGAAAIGLLGITQAFVYVILKYDKRLAKELMDNVFLQTNTYTD